MNILLDYRKYEIRLFNIDRKTIGYLYLTENLLKRMNIVVLFRLLNDILIDYYEIDYILLHSLKKAYGKNL